MLEKKKLAELSTKLIANNVDFMSAFRNNMYMYLENKNITLAEISELSGIPYPTLRTFLYGNSRDTNLSNAIKLAKTFGVSVDELVGAETIPELTRESLSICRNLPDNDLMLVRWFIRCLANLNSQNEPNKRYIKVMLPEEDNDGNCKLVSKFENMEITDLQEPLRSKIFMGFKVISDYYMPYYKPNDIILIANDRPAKFNEHILVRVGDFIYIVKRILENGIGKLYSIRDNKYRVDESEIDEIVGYVAYSLKV